MRRAVLAALMALLAFGGHARADNFPSHPITLVVPFSAGGPTDAMARILADQMRTTLGQNIVIENVTGAAGSLGVGRVVRAAPDGYTVSIGHLGTHVANGAIYKLGYDLVTDLEPVVLLPSNPMIIVSNNAVPAKTLKELIAWLKAKPTPGHGRHRGRRFGQPHRRALFRKRHRHQAAICAVSRHRAGADRPRRGPDRYHHRPDLQFDRPGARRHHPRLCRHRRQARRVGGGYSDHRRSRIERISHDAVVRACGCRKAPRRTSSPNSMPRRSTP